MSHITRKPVFAICKQQRRRSAAHPHSLISTFVVRCLHSIIPRLALAEISRLYLVSEAEQTGSSLTWSKTPKTGFLVTRLKYQRYLFLWLGSFRDKSNGGGDTNEPRHDKTNKVTVRPARVFAVRMKKPWGFSYPLSAQRRLWSDWADAQADLSLRWVHTHFVGFVMSRLKWRFIFKLQHIMWHCGFDRISNGQSQRVIFPQ